jgi:lipid biosynthesis B12-binding/radical SAM protein
MKVLLVSGNTAESPYPVYPLGLSIVAGSLRCKGHGVSLFDFLHQECSLERLADRVKTFRPEVVGISIRNIDNVNLVHEQRYLDRVRAMVDAIRATGPVPVVLGGSGFSLMPETILACVGADYGIQGEGEEAFDRLLQLLARGETPPQRLVLAEAPIPGAEITGADYDPDVLAFYLKKSRLVPIQTKRGCARQCAYCTYPVLEGARIRARPVAKVVDEMQSLLSGATQDGFFFVDSLFNDARGTYRTLIHEMDRRGLCRPWTAFFGPSPELDDEIVALMKKTGLRTAELGADAMSDATLAGLNKGFRFRDVVATNELFLRHDISTAHFFMVGGPGETPDTLEEGIQNVLALRQTVNFFFLGIRIIPHTPLMRRALAEGVLTGNEDLLKPVYYLSPHIDPERTHRRLAEAFANKPHCVFPPDALDDKLQTLCRMGLPLDESYRMLHRE